MAKTAAVVATHEMIIAGFGGQGVMTAGLLLAYAGMEAGLHVSWIPSYGPEQRGGTAHAAVVLSHRPVANPLVTEPTAALVMNEPSLAKFAPRVRPGGVLVVNTSMTGAGGGAGRGDIRVIGLPATELAIDLGDARVANMVAVGALLQATGALPMAALLAALPKLLDAEKHHLIPVNQRALALGAQRAGA